MNKFKNLFEREKHQKIYYFYRYGEIIDSTEADNPDDAIEQFLKIYQPKDFDYLLEWDKKHGYYMTYRYDNNKTSILGHR